ncbi:hypothetical protein Ancab_018528 [Ancistrocladus abbreviatus]
MLGAGSRFNRSRGGEDRFYNPAKIRRHYQNQKGQNELQRAHSDIIVGQCKENFVVSGTREPENRAEETPKPLALLASEPVPALSNVERFLESITPSVSAQYLSKTTMRGWRTCDVEFQPYFLLSDLWESFKEWSAYGAGVPLVLNGSDSVVQYYVPYLSGIQIYVDSSKSPVNSRQTSDDSDGDYFSRDSSSDGSSDSERERGLAYSRGQRNHQQKTRDLSLNMERLTLRGQQSLQQGGFSSDEGESGNSQSYLLFEYLEHDPPYSREPLADKICDLAFRFPVLKTLRSCDILPSSWISVAWYPIYRIPTGPTLKDLDACFLTYHSLYTPIGDVPGAHAPVLTYPSEMDGIPKISLPVFGLASYKFRGSLWTSNGGTDRQLVNSLLQAADNWLRLLQVNHPDFLFFCRR